MADRCMPLADGTYSLSSPFGNRDGGPHRGMDFAAKDGTPIYAAQSGTVVHIGPASGFGQWIVLDHDDAEGSGTTVYGHMWNAFATGLKAGSRVSAGQLIAYVGSNGQSSGPHLHFEVHPTIWRQGSQIDPAPWLRGSRNPTSPTKPAPAPPAPAPAPPGGKMQAPFTGDFWSPNRSKRSKGNPRWIAIHTQEGGRTARDLAAYLANPASEVSYHVVVDDREVLKCVGEQDRPWAAANANDYAFHVCAAGSYAGWSRGKWLETDARDGKNEDVELTNLAHVCAWWCEKYAIPAEWIGGRGIPWGRDGICGHADFGDWGGGHHDPGVGFPVDELIRRTRGFLGTGAPPAPLPPVAPVILPNTDPAPVAGVLLYRGRIGQDPNLVRVLQERLKRAYSKLVVDGDFGPATEAAVRDYQHLHPPLVADGIVGPATAAALGLRF